MNKMRRKIRRPRWTTSKTQIFGVLLIVFGAIQAHSEILTGLFSEETTSYLISGIGIIVYVLRAYTTKSLYDKYREYEGSGNVDSPDGGYYDEESRYRGPHDY